MNLAAAPSPDHRTAPSRLRLVLNVIAFQFGWFACVCQNQSPETTSNNAATPPTNILCMTFPHDDITAIGPQSYHPVKAWPISRNPVTFRTDMAKMDRGRSFRPLGNAGSG